MHQMRAIIYAWLILATSLLGSIIPDHYRVNLSDSNESSVDIIFHVDQKIGQFYLDVAPHIHIPYRPQEMIMIRTKDDQSKAIAPRVYCALRQEERLLLQLDNPLELNVAYVLTFRTPPRKIENLVPGTRGSRPSLVFPCVEDDQYKATFSLNFSIAHSKLPVLVFGNTDLQKFFTIAGVQHFKLFRTEAMSPKDLAWNIAGGMSARMTKCGVMIRAAHNDEMSSKTSVQLKLATATLQFLNKNYARPIGMQKIDLVPETQMVRDPVVSKPGIITLNHAYLAAEKNSYPDSWIKEIGYSLSQGIATQWINYFIPKLRSDEQWFWKGFAAWASWIFLGEYFPNANVWEDFLVFTQESFVLDASMSPNAKGKENEVFIVRMVIKLVGREAFTHAVKTFLEAASGSQIYQESILQKLSTLINFDLVKFCNSWRQSHGILLVEVKRATEDELVFEQRILMPNYSRQYVSKPGQWPIIYGKHVYLEGSIRSKWDLPVVFNEGYMQPFRTLYPADWYLDLTANSFLQMPTLHQLGIMLDAFHLSKLNYLPIKVVFHLIKLASSSNESSVWNLLGLQLQSLRNMLAPFKDIEELFMNFVFERILTQYQRLGFQEIPQESQDDVLIRSNVLFWAGQCRHQQILTRSQQVFTESFNGSTRSISEGFTVWLSSLILGHPRLETIPKELLLPILVNTVLYNDSQAIDAIIDMSLTACPNHHYFALRLATSFAPDREQKEYIYNAAITNPIQYEYLVSNPENHAAMLQHFFQYWPTQKAFITKTFMIILKVVTEQWALDKLAYIFEMNKDQMAPGDQRMIQSKFADAASAVKWAKSAVEEIRASKQII